MELDCSYLEAQNIPQPWSLCEGPFNQFFIFFLFITLHTETQTNMKLLLCCNII